jgi:ABC-type cobalamin/Fe3+-siderophores transport system ATPase subunit
LLRVAAGMERPGGGRVSFAGQNVWALSERDRTELLVREIGWLRRDTPELDAPVLERIAMSLSRTGGRREAHMRAERALARVGVLECGEFVWEGLSDRERTLVVVAEAIVREPRLLVADDLTVGLNALEIDEVMRLLASLARERNLGVLASVGDARETRWADRTATLSDGELLISRRSHASWDGEIVDLPT